MKKVFCTCLYEPSRCLMNPYLTSLNRITIALVGREGGLI